MKKKLLKSEKIRMKNDKLRAQGVDLEKRWGKKMVNSGITSSAMAGSPGTNPANLESKGTKALSEQDKGFCCKVLNLLSNKVE